MTKFNQFMIQLVENNFWNIFPEEVDSAGNEMLNVYNKVTNIVFGYILYPVIGIISLILLFEIILIGVKLKKAGDQGGEAQRKEAKSKMLNCFLAMILIIGSSTLLPLIIKGLFQAFR